MALSRQSNRIPPLVAAVSGALLLAALAPAQAAPTANPIANCEVHIDGENPGPLKLSKTKGGDTSVNLDKAKITACNMEIVAKHAHGTSLDFDDSTWTFSGDVHVHLGEQQAKLSSDEAVVKFSNKEVKRLDIKGSPAEFEQKRPNSDELTRGHANSIVYEAGAGTITLQDDVWLNDSGKEIRGPNLVYDIRNAEVSNKGGNGNRSAGQPFRIVID